MASQFLGRVLESVNNKLEAGSEFVGPHHVMFPTSRQDLAAALQLVRGRRVHVRSGRQVAAADKVDATGDVVLDLEAFQKVRADAQSVVAEAAATGHKLAETLVAQGRALPIPDTPERSIASSLLRRESSLLTRTLGPLRDFVVSAKGLSPNGERLLRRDGGKGGAAVIERVREAKGILTDIKLRTVDAAPLWLLRHTFAYTGPEDFSKLARSLFLRDRTWPKGLDVAVEGFTGPYGIPMVTVSVAGKSKPHRALAEDVIREAVAHLPAGCSVEESRFECRGEQVLSALGESVRGALSDLGTETFGFLADTPSDWVNLVDRFSRDLEQGLSSPETMKLSSRLQLNALDQLEISGLATAAAAKSVAHSFVEGLSSPAVLSPPAPLTLPSGRIPGFRGDVVMPQDGKRYREAKKQYAGSSYPTDRMSPFMVAYPQDPKDVGVAVLFAKEKGKRVVARSGGHQYSGKSSGGDDTILLSLDALNRLEPDVDPVVVGPAVRLEDLAGAFAEKNVTIPHGECPKVAIGGHAQTGGYGHLARAFGLAMDFVESFDIVLGDGSQRTVQRPNADTSDANDALFAAVLSGNAGSFGIVTEYRFNVIHDHELKEAFVYIAARWYQRSLFRQLMEQAQHWTRLLVQGDLPDGIDFMMTARSRDSWVIPPLVLIELVGQPDIDTKAQNLLESVVDISKNGFRLRRRKGHEPLSRISHMFVRNGLEITKDGREFREPYEKRVNCTKQALTDDFVREFVDIVDDVVDAWPGVKLIFQMLIGGGANQRNGESGHTAIPHRDLVYKFVFDLFYKKGSRDTAKDFQGRMQTVIERHFNHGQENRVFWGSFGDTTMSDAKVRNMYYDNLEQYARLQQIKRDVDPDNVFRTDFTVQP